MGETGSCAELLVVDIDDIELDTDRAVSGEVLVANLNAEYTSVPDDRMVDVDVDDADVDAA